MELTAAVEALRHIESLGLTDRKILVYTDSQYLADLPRRKSKLLKTGLISSNKIPLANADLILQLLRYLGHLSLSLVKVPSHEKENGVHNYNREVDKASRKIVRESIREHKDKE